MDAAGFPPVGRPLHTWRHSQLEQSRCSRGNERRQSQWGRLAEQEWAPAVLSEGPCFLERNKPPTQMQRGSPQQPISRFGISCCTFSVLAKSSHNVLPLSAGAIPAKLSQQFFPHSPTGAALSPGILSVLRTSSREILGRDSFSLPSPAAHLVFRKHHVRVQPSV